MNLITLIFLLIIGTSLSLHGNFVQGSSIIRCVIVNLTSTSTELITPYDPLKPNPCQSLVLTGNTLPEIPVKLFGIYENLEAFTATHGVLTVIRTNTFTSPSIRSIDLSYNLISSIEPNAFSGAITLNHLELAFNKISTLGANMFQGLTLLRYLGVAYNDLTELSATPFTDLPGLKTFKAPYNKIQTIAPDTFQSLSFLKVLDLANNSLVALNLNFNHADICFIAVPDNELKVIKITATPDVSTGIIPCGLRFLAFNNQLRKIDIDSNLRVRELVLSNNNLTDLTGVSPHVGLRALVLDNNSIRVHGGALDNLTFLEELNLSKNFIFHIDNTTFRNQSRLVDLNLSENPLRILDFANLTGLTHLGTLELDNTAILRIKLVGLKLALPNLTTIHITRTHWNCSFLQVAIDAFSSLGITLKASPLNPAATLTDFDTINGIECIPDAVQRYSDDDIKGIVENGTLESVLKQGDEEFATNYFLNLRAVPAFRAAPVVSGDGSSQRVWAIGLTGIIAISCVGVYLVMKKRNVYLRTDYTGIPDSRTKLLG